MFGGIAILVGLILSPIPRNFGLYRWIASKDATWIGFTPAFLDKQKPWGYTFDELELVHRLTGQNALVTGANSGIGYEIALGLARLGASSVTLACRTTQRCEMAAARIRADSKNGGESSNSSIITTMTIDTSSLSSVKNFGTKFVEMMNNNENTHQLDMLYLNAGVGGVGAADEEGFVKISEDGIELVFATNHVGHHLLYKYVEPLLLKSKMARVVLTSSGSSFGTFDYKVATDLKTLNGVNIKSPRHNALNVYGQSKLAQILFAKELTRRLGEQSNNHVYVNAAHPGAVNSAIWDKNPLLHPSIMGIVNYLRKNVMWTTAEGALTLLYLGVATDQLQDKAIRGKYFHPQSQEVVNPLAMDEELQKRLWEFSDELVKDFLPVHVPAEQE